MNSRVRLRSVIQILSGDGYVPGIIISSVCEFWLLLDGAYLLSFRSPQMPFLPNPEANRFSPQPVPIASVSNVGQPLIKTYVLISEFD